MKRNHHDPHTVVRITIGAFMLAGSLMYARAVTCWQVPLGLTIAFVVGLVLGFAANVWLQWRERH